MIYDSLALNFYFIRHVLNFLVLWYHIIFSTKKGLTLQQINIFLDSLPETKLNIITMSELCTHADLFVDLLTAWGSRYLLL